MNSLKKIFRFLNIRKKYWLTPVLLAIVLFGGLLILSKGSQMIPFIYNFF